MSGSIGEIVRFGLPEDYFTTYPDKIRALTVADLVKAAEKVAHPDQLVWLVVGDRAKIEPGIRELGWGEVQLLERGWRARAIRLAGAEYPTGFTMRRSGKYFIVLTTAPNQKTARALARSALQNRLIACANLIPKIESHYWWRGKIEKSAEVLILMKTTR